MIHGSLTRSAETLRPGTMLRDHDGVIWIVEWRAPGVMIDAQAYTVTVSLVRHHPDHHELHVWRSTDIVDVLSVEPIRD